VKVVDASVLCDFLLGRDAAVDALTDDARRAHQPLHCPELVEPEVLNALRRLVRAGTLDLRRADEAVADLADVRVVRYPHAPLRLRVWELRESLTAYDATYLALAEALDGSVLLTGDRGLASRARATLGADRVQRIT
jgi:predicted nucleic acid-binding protein